MKVKPQRVRRYINHGAIPTNEYTSATMNSSTEMYLSEKEESGSVQELNTDQARFKLPVKVLSRQQFRQDRTGKQKPSGTSLGWRTNRTSHRNTGSDNNR